MIGNFMGSTPLLDMYRPRAMEAFSVPIRPASLLDSSGSSPTAVSRLERIPSTRTGIVAGIVESVAAQLARSPPCRLHKGGLSKRPRKPLPAHRAAEGSARSLLSWMEKADCIAELPNRGPLRYARFIADVEQDANTSPLSRLHVGDLVSHHD